MSLQHIRIKNGRLSEDERRFVFGASRISLTRLEGAPARKYLGDRGVDMETAAQFSMGYVPPGAHIFSERVVMPIFDVYGDLLALSVRPITEDKSLLDEYLKYWNESYPKGEHLFGMHLAKLPIVRRGFAILVEGQMDVISLHAAGFTNAVAVLGGAFTHFQAMLLKRWTSQVVLMFDGDSAGIKHRERCREVLDAYGFKRKWLTGRTLASTHVELDHSGAKDPNQYIKRFGAVNLKGLVCSSMDKAGLQIGDWTEK